MNIPKVKAILILDNEGKRICGRYYAPPFLNNSKYINNFEKKLFEKSSKSPLFIYGSSSDIRLSSDIYLHNNNTVIFTALETAIYAVVIDLAENELLGQEVLTALTSSVGIVLNNTVDILNLKNSIHFLIFIIDEICNTGDGVIIDTNGKAVAERVLNNKGAGYYNNSDKSLSESSRLSQAIGIGIDQVVRAFNQ